MNAPDEQSWPIRWWVLAVGAAPCALLPLLPTVEHEGRRLGPGSLLPALVAVVLSLGTGRLGPALGLATLSAAVVLHGPFLAVPRGVADYVVGNLTNRGHLTIIAFVLALLGMVSVMGRSGGTSAVVGLARRRISTRRGTRVGAAVMGCVVFFDDYANCMIAGPALRPLFDRFGISRERLAYVVDATAAPIAGLVPLSTWIGYEVGLLDGVLGTIGSSMGGYTFLLTMLPFRFYCGFALVLVFLTAATERELGPMIAAERRAVRAAYAAAQTGDGVAEGDAGRASDALLPLTALLLGVVVGFVVAGGGVATLIDAPSAVFEVGFWKVTLSSVYDGPLVLLAAATLGAVLAIALPALGGRVAVSELLAAGVEGLRVASTALVVLVLAWALAGACGDVGTGPYMARLLDGSLPPWAVPVVTFVTAAGIAFATGTSWGTMAMLLPTAVPVAAALGQWWLVPMTAAAVLDGAIFGDHCSPISDTTVMSSIGAGCDHLAHVRTQLPYALVAMGVTLLAGYGAASQGVPAAVCWIAGCVALIVVVRAFGTRVVRGDRSEPSGA